MGRVTDKAILMFGGIVFLTQMDAVIEPVVIFLTALCTVALGIYFTKRNNVVRLAVFFLLVCIFLPGLICFLPIVLYDCTQYKIKWGAVLVPAVALYQCYPYHRTFFGTEGVSYELWQMLLLVFMLLLAVVLEWRSSKLENLETEFIRMRDASTELNLVLKEKNKDLMEKQDYEIYLATLKERNRIAREIHDHVGHMLSRSILQIGALLTINKDETADEMLNSVKDTLNQAMTNIRESVHDLHDESIDLKQAVYEATAQMQEQYHVDIDYDMTPAVPRNVKYCLISIIKEAMSNVVKHSNADHITIILREHPAFYQLAIEDNGTVKNVSLQGGMGMENMRERVAAFGGTFRVSTENGFKIFISIGKKES